MSTEAITRITYGSNVYSNVVHVEHPDRLSPGMEIQLSASSYLGSEKRLGRARIQRIVGDAIHIQGTLSQNILAAASGDYVYGAEPERRIPPPQGYGPDQFLVCRNGQMVWEQRPNADFELAARISKIEKMFEGVCTEHDDCKASLLAHACKESQRQSEEKK